MCVIQFVCIEWLLLLGRCFHRHRILTLFIYFCTVIRHASKNKHSACLCEERNWDEVTVKRKGEKVKRLKRIAKLVQFSIADILCGYLAKGESFSFATHTHAFVVVVIVFFSLTFMRFLTTDQICNEYKSHKFSFGWSATESTMFYRQIEPLSKQCFYKDIMQYRLFFLFSLSTFATNVVRCACVSSFTVTFLLDFPFIDNHVCNV